MKRYNNASKMIQENMANPVVLRDLTDPQVNELAHLAMDWSNRSMNCMRILQGNYKPKKNAKVAQGEDESDEDKTEEEFDRALFDLCTVKKLRPDTFDSMIGLNNVKKELMKKIVDPLKNPNISKKAQKPKRQKFVLSFGVPGTFKTAAFHALCHELKDHVKFVLAIGFDKLKDKYKGQSAKAVRRLFNMLRRFKPCLILIDEADAIFAEGNESYGPNDGVISTFLDETDPNKIENVGIILYCCTNNPERFVEGFHRRFTCKLYHGLPSKEERELIIKQQLNKTKHCLTQGHIAKIANLTKGRSGFDVAMILENACDAPMTKVLSSTHFTRVPTPLLCLDFLCQKWHISDKKFTEAEEHTYDDEKVDDYCLPAVTVNDVLNALRAYPVTITNEHLKKHQNYATKINVKINEPNLKWETLKWKSVAAADVSI